MTLFVFAVGLASADPDEVRTLSIVAAAVAAVVGIAPLEIFADVLHIRREGISFIIIYGRLQKVRINWNGIYERVFSVAFFIISVAQRKRSSLERDLAVKLALGGDTVPFHELALHRLPPFV